MEKKMTKNHTIRLLFAALLALSPLAFSETTPEQPKEVTPMNPTEILKNEHKVVLIILDGAEREAKNIQSTGSVDTEKVAKMLDFFKNFVDKCHHSKEERQLFPTLEKRGMAHEGGPIECMLQEHTLGRNEIAAITANLEKVKAGDADAAKPLAAAMLAYVELLRNHIDKEDNILFTMADRVLTPEDNEELTKAFDKIESEEMGEGVHEQYHQFAHELMEH